MKDFKHIFPKGRLVPALVFFILLVAGTRNCHAQTLMQRTHEQARQVQNNGTAIGPNGKPFIYLHYKVIKGDTVFVEKIRPSKCYSRLPRQKSKEWRKYYRLVHNFAKTYPYALASKKILLKVDSTIVAEGMKRGKRDKYINQIQKELLL